MQKVWGAQNPKLYYERTGRYPASYTASNRRSGGGGGGGGGGGDDAITPVDNPRKTNAQAAYELTGGAADTSYLNSYTTLAKYQNQWADLDMYANGGSSKAQLRKIINDWEKSGKISSTAADEMYYSYNLG